jgi:transposase
LREENRALQEESRVLRQQLEWLQRQVFGRKSEKLIFESPDQLRLELGVQEEATVAPVESEQISYTRRKKNRGDSVTDSGLRFNENVPVKVIEVPAPELSGGNKNDYEVIGKQVTRRLAQRPASYVIIEYHRPVVKHKKSERIKTPPAPATIFERTFADVSFLAGLLVDKFRYHLPLYRQHQRLADCGVQVSRATLTNYVQRSIELLAPIYEAQRSNILQSRVLAVDETPIKAGRKKAKKPKQPGQMKTTWFWPIYGDDNEVYFSWSKTRGAVHLEEELREFKGGVLLSDGYQAYDHYAKNKPKVTQAQCWAHTRRYFERAKESDKAALDALQKIAEIYRVESRIREKIFDREKTLAYRGLHAKPLVAGFFDWCETQQQRADLVDSDLLSRALRYALRHREQLELYLQDPDLPIDTNHLERTLRVIPMGRKAWLFCWTELGARQVGMIQTLLTTCRLQSVDPYTYLVDVLQRIATHPQSRIEELTPRCWKKLFADKPLRSDLDPNTAADAPV